MPCENHRQSLIDAAAADSQPPRELRLHMDACASCRAAFIEEQQFFQAIEAGLSAAANADVLPGFLPRVSVRLEVESVRQRRFTPTLILAAAGAAIVLTAFIGWRSHYPAKVEPANPVLATVSREEPTTPSRLEVAGAVATVTPSRSHRVRPRRNSASPVFVSSDRQEVLVPPDEREAFARFVRAQQEQSDVITAVVTPPSEGEDKPQSVKALQIAKLVVTPLEPLVDNAPDGTQDE